jgi:hypothetical protein
MSRPVVALAVDNTAVLVKTGPVKVREIEFHNNSAGDVHLQMFDAATAGDVTVGTTVPDWSPGVHTTSNGNDVLQLSGLELMFGKGLVIAATTTPNGSTPPTTSGSIAAVNLGLDDG